MNFGVRKLLTGSLLKLAVLFWIAAVLVWLSHGAIMWRYLRDPSFSRFDTIPECDRHTHTDRKTDRRTDRHTTTAYTGVCINHAPATPAAPSSVIPRTCHFSWLWRVGYVSLSIVHQKSRHHPIRRSWWGVVSKWQRHPSIQACKGIRDPLHPVTTTHKRHRETDRQTNTDIVA